MFVFDIAAGFGHISRTCHSSQIRMQCLWVNALYSENSAFLQALISCAMPLTGLLPLLADLS